MKEKKSKRGVINEEVKKETFGKKLRFGKKDLSLTAEEIKKKETLLSQGRGWISRERIQRTFLQEQEEEEDRKDLGGEFGSFLKEVSKEVGEKTKNHIYGKKLKTKEEAKESDFKGKAKEEQKAVYQKKRKGRMTEEYAKKNRKNTAVFGGREQGKKPILEKLEKLLGEKRQFHFLLIIFFLVAVILIFSALFSSCAMVGKAVTYAALASSYTAEKEEILETEEAYLALEEEMKDRLDSIEQEYPGYDEYRYEIDEIGHDPHLLAALLTVLFEDYRKEEVEGELASLFLFQYEFTTEEIIERKIRTETVSHWETDLQGNLVEVEQEVEIEEEIRILKVVLNNKGIEGMVEAMALSEDQLQRFRLLEETKGNHPEYFEVVEEAEPVVMRAAGGGYRPRAEYLTKESFRRMMDCAMTYLGTPYVWGGSSPETGFDCSGFVSFVLNNSGNGWEIGRQNVRGLVNICTKIEKEEAQPGDLIFFQGTTDIPGVSHVGIYVGDGMMIHCGDPISFTSIETSYWREHFHSFGRMK